jgi:hypothetical protein
MSHGAAAARGGQCSQYNGLNDVMPELLPIDESQRQVLLERLKTMPQFERLNNLMQQHNRAMSNPSVTQTVKDNILEHILTDDVKADAGEIFKEMFGIELDTQNIEHIVHILNCIIKAFINDLSVFRCIQMTGTLCLKAFYKIQGFRIAVAASFVGSTFYVGWISGIGQLCGLGLSGCQIVFSALAACHHLIYDPKKFMEQFVPLLGDNASVVGKFIASLNGAIVTPSLFAGLVAQGNVALLERMYSAGAGAGAGAGAPRPPGDGHLDNLRTVLEAEIARRRAIGEDATQLEAALALLIQPAPAAAPVPPLAPAAAPVPPPAAAADGVFNQMYRALTDAGGVYGDYVKTYIMNLYRYLNRVKQVFPGVVAPPGADFLSYSCNVFNDRIIQVFGIMSAQFAHAGINERQTKLATLLEFILPSNLRESIFQGDVFSASKEMGILAFRLKPSIIDCLSEFMTREHAIALLEGCSILFTPTVTEANVDSFVSSMPHVILERLLLLESPELSRESHDSQTAQPPMTPLRERLSTLHDDMINTLRKHPGIFFSDEELKEFEKTHGRGFKAAFMKLLNVQPSVAIASVAEFAACSFMHNVIGGDITSFEQAAAPKLLSKAHQKFLPLENLFSRMWQHLFTIVNQITDEADHNLTREEIIEMVQAKLGFRVGVGVDVDKFNNYVRTALIGFKLSCLWNPVRCTFTPAIVFVKGTQTPMAVMVLDIESTTTEVDPDTQFIKLKYILPISFFESGGVSVSQGVVTTAASALEAVKQPVMAFTGALNFVMNGAMSFGRNFLPCSMPNDASVQVINDQADAADAVFKEIALGIEGAEDNMEEGVTVTSEQQAKIDSILELSQPVIPVIPEMIDGDALAADSEELPDSLSDSAVAEATLDADLEGSPKVPVISRAAAERFAAAVAANTTRPRERDLTPPPSQSFFDRGGSHSRRIRRSSTRSSTTRGRKAASRRNKSKKRKQNSRRRSTRKTARKN